MYNLDLSVTLEMTVRRLVTMGTIVVSLWLDRLPHIGIRLNLKGAIIVGKVVIGRRTVRHYGINSQAGQTSADHTPLKGLDAWRMFVSRIPHPTMSR